MNSNSSFFTINKDVFFKTIRDSFSSNELLLEAVKKDITRMECKFNGRICSSYVDFVETVRKTCPQYLERLLLLTNQNAHFLYFNTVFNILTKHKLHIISDTDSSSASEERHYKTHITINPMVHQVVLHNLYKVIEVNAAEVSVLRFCKITTIIDLMVLDPVVIQIQYVDN